MDILIWIGAAITLAGFVGIVASIVMVTRARRAGLDDATLRARLQRVLPLNLGALFLSVIGLFVVVAGIMLG
ncbi:MAG: hypothetical protein GW886_10605 [Rhodobacterales bacterium]|nr:hypothetical protein [Rhodobacterales bacterium]NCT12381.1 hypothetical protein [Rhodobacterales bacterium]